MSIMKVVVKDQSRIELISESSLDVIVLSNFWRDKKIKILKGEVYHYGNINSKDDVLKLQIISEKYVKINDKNDTETGNYYKSDNHI